MRGGLQEDLLTLVEAVAQQNQGSILDRGIVAIALEFYLCGKAVRAALTAATQSLTTARKAGTVLRYALIRG